jgi:hypothetical protein
VADHQLCVIAYAALVAAPTVTCARWRTYVGVFALVLVGLAALQAGRTLWNFNAIRVLEHARLEEAKKHLPLMDSIHKMHPPMDRWERPFPVWVPPRLRFPWGLLVVVGLGAVFASVIILLRIRWRWADVPVFVVACAASANRLPVGLDPLPGSHVL